MSPTETNVNAGVEKIAPLKNVRLFIELMDKMQHRKLHLPGLAVFYGFSGLGKSQSAINAANKYNAAYVECGQSWNPTTLVDAIFHEITGHRVKGTVAFKVAEIIEGLADGQRPLIIDESDYLVKRAMIDLVREISDRSGSAVILIGEEQMPIRLQAFERAHNRVLYWQPAMPASMEDARSLAKLYVPQLDIKDDLLKHITSTTDGVTRRLVANLERVREFAATRNLQVVDLAAWGDTTVYTGMPTPRNARRSMGK